MNIVTRDSLQKMLDNDNPQYVAKVIGRALVALLKNQTEDERATNLTNENNGIGFTGADARSATLTAKSFMKKGTLEDWQIEKWTRKGKNGYSRLTKYHKQLNIIAMNKVA